MSELRIIAAALRFGDVIVLTERPGRHHHALHGFAKMTKERLPFEQGFLTSTGMFVPRDIAYEIAKQANQIIKKSGSPNSEELYSEDVW